MSDTFCSFEEEIRLVQHVRLSPVGFYTAGLARANLGEGIKFGTLLNFIEKIEGDLGRFGCSIQVRTHVMNRISLGKLGEAKKILNLMMESNQEEVQRFIESLNSKDRRFDSTIIPQKITQERNQIVTSFQIPIFKPVQTSPQVYPKPNSNTHIIPNILSPHATPTPVKHDPAQCNPQPPAQCNPQPPAQCNPQPPAQCNPQPPTQYNPQPPAQCNPPPPAYYNPQPPVQFNPPPPTQYNPQPPTQYNPQPPVQCNSPPPTQYNPQTPVQYNPQPPAYYNPQPPAQFNPPTPVQCNPPPPAYYSPQPPAYYNPKPPAQCNPQPPAYYNPQPVLNQYPQLNKHELHSPLAIETLDLIKQLRQDMQPSAPVSNNQLIKQQEDIYFKQLEEERASEELAKKLQQEFKNELSRPTPTILKCALCFEQAARDLITLKHCGHIFHTNCLRNHLQILIDNQISNSNCPALNCEKAISNPDITTVCPSHMQNQINALKAAAGNLTACLNPNCSYNFNKVPDMVFYSCVHCNLSYCLLCNCKAHPNRPCNQYDYSSVKAVPVVEQLYVSSRCPICAKIVFKYKHGKYLWCECDYAFCSKCKKSEYQCQCPNY